MVVVPADHPLAALTEISFAETLEYDLVGLNTGLHAIRLTDPWARRSLWLGVRLRAALASEALTLLDHLRHGGQLCRSGKAAGTKGNASTGPDAL